MHIHRRFHKFGKACHAALLALGLMTAPAGAAERITVVTEEFPPFNYLEHGVVRGYSVDVVTQLLEQAGLEHTLALYPWARAYRMAQSQPNVLIFSIARTPEREALFHWIGALSRHGVYLYKLAARSDIALTGLDDVKRYRVAANRQGAAQGDLEAIGLVVGRQIDLSDHDHANMRKLLAGRVDLQVGTEASIRRIGDALGVPEGRIERTLLLSAPREYFVAASLATPPATVALLRAQFRKLQASQFLVKAAARYRLPAE